MEMTPLDHRQLANMYAAYYAEKPLQRSDTTSTTESERAERVERARWPPLTRLLMSGEISTSPARELTTREKFDRWMVNEGAQRLFIVLFAFVHVMVFAFGFVNYQLKDNLSDARATFGFTYPIARAAALTLHFDVALILFPVCRTIISLLRQTPLNGIVQFDKNITFHKLVAYSMVFFTWVHIIAHWNNFAQLAAKENLGFKGFLLINFTTGPGWSGYIMVTALMIMLFTAIEKPRRANYERFWSFHHLFIAFFAFWSIHGAFCMIKADTQPFCAGDGFFWKWWMAGGFTYLVERLLRELRGHHKTCITKVIQHPSNVVEIQIHKEKTKTRAGQYIFLCCPEVSLWQYHPFTLTSAPEEDYLSVHIRCVGNFTKALAKSLGCDFETKTVRDANPGPAPKSQSVIATIKEISFPVVKTTTLKPRPKSFVVPMRAILPRLYIDGPFGSASEDVFKFETAVLVGAGIGVTPFASILKSIWYRMNNNSASSHSRLKKVYFFWICRDFESLEWFQDLLRAIEDQQAHSPSRNGALGDRIEVHTYLTARVKIDDAQNIMINDSVAQDGRDAITGLHSATKFGRPDWDRVFRGIRRLHGGDDDELDSRAGGGSGLRHVGRTRKTRSKRKAEAGVFFCGPEALGSQLHGLCNRYSGRGWGFVWGKENF